MKTLYYCKDCGKEISWHSGHAGQGRCHSCAQRVKPNLGLTKIIYYCKECKNIISRKSGRDGLGYCLSCSKKGERSPNFIHGKSGTNEYARKLQMLQRAKDMKNCPYCKTSFHPTKIHKIYCSEECFKLNNKTYMKKYLKDYSKLGININTKLANCLRHRIWQALKGICKSAHTMELVGCNIEQLKEHLEKQFTKGMNWLNWGFYGWHIDHIKTCYSFDLSIPEQQKQCFNYTNLRPLWAEENLSRKKK
jgi:hypothetical protein